MGKLLLVLGIALAFYFYSQRQDDTSSIARRVAVAISPKPKREVPSPPAPVSAPATPVQPPPAQPLPAPMTGLGGSGRLDGPASVLGPPGGPVSVPALPATWERFQMRYRAVPSAEFLQRWGAFGVEAIADPVGRLVVMRGDEQAVSALRGALEALDTVPGTCCVQAWTVYVDRTAERGFDLVSALGAVTSGDTVLELGSGGLTLDVSMDRVAAALRVIADGGVVEVVQNSHVRLVDGQAAKVESIQEVPVPETVVSQGVSQQSIDFRKVGLQLEVMPSFLADDRLRLSMVQVNGVVGSKLKVGDAEVPVIQSQTVSTVAELTVGQTLVLGGVRTVRRSLERGLFGKSEQQSEGSLYVVLATYSDEPRAVPVDLPSLEFPAGMDRPAPFTVPAEDPAGWIRGELLPPKGWEREERAFLRSRAAK